MTTQTVKPQQEQTPTMPEPYGPIVLRLDPVVQLTDVQLAELSSLNDTLRIERNAQGELEILPPANITTGNQELGVGADLLVWARGEGSGAAFGPTAGFTLPNSSVRSPDASWVLKSRLAELTEEQKQHGFPPICPDFVIEVRSYSDSLAAVRRKMEEYIENGARLGWLIDPLDPRRRVYIYRPSADVEIPSADVEIPGADVEIPDSDVEILEGPESLSGEPELPGFTLDLKFIWEPDF